MSVRTVSVKSVAAAAVMMMVAAPAFAASGTYTFGAKFKQLLDSGAWDQGAGTDSYSFTCTAGTGERYSVTLFKNSIFGDDNKGSKTFTCDSTKDTGSWTGLSSGKYHLTFSKAKNGVYVVGSGGVAHP